MGDGEEQKEAWGEEWSRRTRAGEVKVKNEYMEEVCAKEYVEELRCIIVRREGTCPDDRSIAIP